MAASQRRTAIVAATAIVRSVKNIMISGIMANNSIKIIEKVKSKLSLEYLISSGCLFLLWL